MNENKRENAEAEILYHLRKIAAIAEEYAPHDSYLTLHLLDGYMGFNNSRYNPDETLDVWVSRDDEVYSFEWKPEKRLEG